MVRWLLLLLDDDDAYGGDGPKRLNQLQLNMIMMNVHV